MAKKLTLENFDEVINSGKLVLVDFWAEWCMPCIVMGPLIEELANEVDKEKVTIAKCDVQTEQAIAQKFSIMSIPTMLIFKDGKPMDQIIGVSQKQALLDKIDRYI
ncbi:MAG: thioredoxin [Candidatus Cloacimonetes bacterium]|nr:thioredoxin [Candidatus Cloacimonadota bacterium]MBL7087009.1 thioredoxin [Candidatus Cloacimonadota bacterium]